MIEIKDLIYDEEAIKHLYLENKWYAYTNQIDLLYKGIKNSRDVYGAYDGDKLVGLLRTVGDGETIIYVQDILILPEYQRQGIGRRLLTLVKEKYTHVRAVVLMTDKEEYQIKFYESLGFVDVDKNGGTTFTLRRKKQ